MGFFDKSTKNQNLGKKSLGGAGGVGWGSDCSSRGGGGKGK